MTTRILSAVTAALLLVSCGGGGGGGGSPSTPGGGDQAPTRSDVQSANPGAARTAAAQAATNLPAFGSVTQSSNRGVAGVTDDAASASFDGRNVSLTVRRKDGSRFSLNGATDRFGSVPGSSTVPGHSFRGDGLLTHTDTSLSLAAVYVSWDNTDPTDYLAGGYWMHAAGSTVPLNITGIEIGAFVDGPELSGAPTVTKLGTATYTGSAGGLYAYRYGSTRDDVPSGSIEIGEFGADASLTANFGAGTISGCLGCNGGATVSGVGTAPNGQTFAFIDVVIPARVRLGATPIGNAGSFRGTNVSVEITGTTVTGTNGSWGGRFSTVSDADGDPRVAAGTAGADWREADGSQGSFVGAWYGATGR